MTDGHPLLVTPAKKTEFYAMVAAMRKHHEAMHDADRAIAVALNLALPRAQGVRFEWARADLHLNARRVTRHLVHAAALNLSAAKSYTRAYVTFDQLFARKPGHTSANPFDLDS